MSSWDRSGGSKEKSSTTCIFTLQGVEDFSLRLAHFPPSSSK